MRGPRPDYGQSDWASQAECDGGKWPLIIYRLYNLTLIQLLFNPGPYLALNLI